jgi:tetratricopeptide (TPR) repeat protein
MFMLYKKFKTVFTGLFLSVTLIFPLFVFAQSAQDYLKQGVKVAESGDYRAALVQFQKAKEAGLDNAALHYNFGVAYYRLGSYENAKKAFTILSSIDRFKQLAYYNLGLVANKQKDKAAAIAWFQRTLRTGRGDRVKILAREALKRLDAEPKKILASNKKWTGLLSASFSSDSNVTLVNEDLAGISSKSDTSIDLSAFGAKWLTGGRADGVRVFLRGYLQNYNTQTIYNYTQFGLGVARYDRLGSWGMRVAGFWDETYLGGTQYQRVLSAEVRARKALSKNNQLRLRYKISSIDATDPVYDYLGGTRQQFRLGNLTRSGENRYRVYYQLELNDREDFENPAGTTYLFRSYSPTRHTIRVTGWWALSDSWSSRLDGRYRTSSYNDDYIRVGNISENRDDTQTRLSARLSKKLDKNLQLEMAYTVTSNDSSIDAESYDRNLVSVGLSSKF